MSKSLFTVRGKKHAKHPQIIVDANKTKFKSVTLTHDPGKTKHWNKPLTKNPNKKDKKKAYYSKQVIEDFKFNFTKAYKKYHLSNDDIKAMITFLENKIKK